jgi:hypothetical protein
MAHRKVVAFEILYRTMYNAYIKTWTTIIKTRLKAIGVHKWLSKMDNSASNDPINTSFELQSSCSR